jgi:epoxyqueuosine reductase
MKSGDVQPEQLNKIFVDIGVEDFGIASIDAPTSLPFYETWLDQGFAGDMTYLHDHLPLKKQPQQLMPQARSVISLLIPYFPHPEINNFPLQHSRVALYAQGTDYHFWIKEKLQQVIAKLTQSFPNETFRAFVDSAPVLERDYAQKAGLGWVGKNTCLINQQKGSLLFLSASSMQRSASPT